MPDLLIAPIPTVVSDETVSRDLAARAGRIGLRVAEVVEASCSDAAGASGAADFLRRWAESVISSAASSEPVSEATPLGRIVKRVGLTEAETSLVLLAGLGDLHEGLAATLRELHPRSLPYPTVGLAALVVEDLAPDRNALRRMLHEGVAVQHGVLHLEEGYPFFERSLLVPDALWSALHGHDCWPARIEPLGLPASPAGLAGWLSQAATQRGVTAMGSELPRLVVVTTADDEVGLSRCAALQEASGRAVVVGRVEADDRQAVQQFCLHAVARDAIPVLVPRMLAEPAGPVSLARVSLTGPLLVVAPSGAVVPRGDLAILQLPLGPVTNADQRRAWSSVVPRDPDLAVTLASRHPLDPALTAQVRLDLHSLASLHDEPGDIASGDVSAAIRARAAASLPSGVELLTARVDWSRLVVPPDADSQLHDAVSRWDHQSLVLEDWDLRATARADRGVRLMFTGPPGTGKSIAGEVLASALGTDLLVVDISRIVSKWIGETEKNLERVFDVAERTQAVLMLDEADALFGTRTEISDAHDRYANLETAYLLQRLDRFDGLAVLATNLKHNIDPAFLRRMDFVVEFDLPDVPSRRALWELHLPASLRADDVNLDELAGRYALPGGWIRNAAIAAAFLAAPSGGPVDRPLLLAALRREYSKAGKPFPDLFDQSPTRDLRALRAIEAASGIRTPTEELR